MAEVSIGGISFKGGKMLAVILALGSSIGVLYGGFEAYKKFQDMSAQIESYVSPDLSEFDKTIALTKEEMKSKTDIIQTEVEMLMSEMEMMMSEIRLVSDVANELKNDLRQDVRRVEKIVNDVEQQVKEDSRDNSKDLKIAINTIEEDMEKLKTDLEEKMKELQESIDKQIKLTLANPLSQMKKMKISDNTAISMPMRNLIGLIVAIGVGIFAYSDVTQRLTQLETARQLMEADLLKKAEQTPVNQELYMLIEFLAGQNEVMETEVQSIESNNINIDFLKSQLEKMQTDVEQLKDKVRKNGNY